MARRGVFTVELDGPTRAQRSFASTDGTFSFGRVDPGAYTVRVTSAPATARRRCRSSRGNLHRSTSPRVERGRHRYGRRPIGKPVAGAAVAMSRTPRRPDPDLARGTAADDQCRRHVPLEAKAGPSALAVLDPASPDIKRGLSLTAGQTLNAARSSSTRRTERPHRRDNLASWSGHSCSLLSRPSACSP